jgi:hypothetical protein
MGQIMQHYHEYRAVFTCSNCRWDNDQTIEEKDDAKPPQKKLAIDCWHCGWSNEVVVTLAEPK